ncbi:hypothetical protein [Actinophytocola oryzae]|uniref:ATP/GTP-binding protein n=1 Tax=Actinophytocola oryzae TaxID=502181 RepID=A0A4R7V5Y9_9PSEU|nr:hypothetical protein [Actinophytocola oryzae]TDV44172.1 hypothetical protein CLV71_11481 [Actinophytocola oryzae]
MLTRPARMSILVVLVLCASTVAAAADDGWGTVECDQLPSPQCDVEVGSASRPNSVPTPADAPAGSPGQDSAQPTCVYQPSPFQGHPNADSWPPSFWYEGLCELTGAIITPTPIAALTPGEVARLARNQLRPPRPRPAANPAGDQLVNLPTWLYLTSAWRPVSASASVPGVTVTATASPTSVTWVVGDDTTVECAGPGSTYDRDTDPRSESPTCGHTYRRSSGHSTFPVIVTIHWAVTWTGGGQAGALPELTTTGTTAFRVRESQALNIAPPTR